MLQSILNINVSCFEKCTGTTPANVNLLSWLTSDKYRDKVEQIRSIQDENLQKTIKKSLPAITPSGIFSYRDAEHQIEHSGFLAFDIDFADNKHISNFSEVREQVSHIKNIAYCGLSVRGHGFWGLVPIPKSTPQEHKQRFNALAKDFKEYGIVLDPSGSDVCRLRIYSYDPEAYFNHTAKLYTKTLKPAPRKSNRPVCTDTRESVEAIISQIRENKIDITEGYDNWLKVGSALVDEFGEAGRGYFHAVSQYHAKYSASETDRMFDNVLKHNNGKVKIGSFFHIAKEYGALVKNTKAIEYVKKEHGTVITLPKVEKIIPVKHGIWDDQIAELEKFFTVIKLPSEPIRLNKCQLITNVSLFVNTHLGIVKGQNGKQRYSPYLDRLTELKTILSLN